MVTIGNDLIVDHLGQFTLQIVGTIGVLDSNNDGVIDDADARATLVSETWDGQTTSSLQLTIEDFQDVGFVTLFNMISLSASAIEYIPSP